MRPIFVLVAALAVATLVATVVERHANLHAGAPPYTVERSLLEGRNVIVDTHSREVVFRGVNVGVEIWKNDKRPWLPSEYANGKCPTPVGSVNQPPVCGVDAGHGKWNQSTRFDSKNDLAQMRALGFNLIRLAISWSLLEPQPLQYSMDYLDRIAQVVEWAAEQDVQVILDWHQDAFSPVVGSDGAPLWACMNVTYPSWVDDIWSKVASSIPYPKAVLLAFDALYMNKKVATTGKGLQEHFMLAWAEVIKRFDASPNVIGYEILNEPPPGLVTTLSSAGDLPVIGFSTEFLFPMYRRFIQAMTGVRDGMPSCSAKQPIEKGCAFPDLGIQSKKLVFFEPMALRNQLDFSLQESKPFTEYKNIVFAPHTYSYSFTFPKWPPSYSLSLDSAWLEADLMGAGVLVTEFGGSDGSLDRVGNITNEFDIHLGTSGTMWTWKENGNWGLFDNSADPTAPNGPLNQARAQINSRCYARVVAGSILEHAFDHHSGAFRLKVVAGIGWTSPTEVYIPPHINQSAPSVSGMATLEKVVVQPDGSRIVVAKPWITGGIYEISLGKLAPPAKSPAYKGVSLATMKEIAAQLWPLNNVSSNGIVLDADFMLQQTLTKLAGEMYPEKQEAIIM